MFNKNGSNNGNGSANGVHKDTAVVARNGNGHKPDAAIVTEHDPRHRVRGWPCSGTGSRPPSRRFSDSPSTPSWPPQRKGRKGQVFDYLEGHGRHRPGQPHLRLWRVGLRASGRRDPAAASRRSNPQTGEVKVEQGYSAPVRVTVAGALPRTDVGVHPVVEDNFGGHDTAIKGAVTDGLKRAFRSFGVQFGNGFYGDQPQAGNQPQPQRVPAPSKGNSGQAQANGKSPVRQAQSPPSTGSGDRRNESQIENLRKRLIEIAAEQGLDEDQVRAAVTDRTGKSLDDLDGTELGPLVEAAANKLRQMQQA